MKLPWPLVFVSDAQPVPRGYGMAYQFELGWVCAPVPLNLAIAAARWVWDGLRYHWSPRGTLGRLMAESYIRGHRKGRNEGYPEAYELGAVAERERITRNFNILLDESARESAARYCDAISSNIPVADPNLTAYGEGVVDDKGFPV